MAEFIKKRINTWEEFDELISFFNYREWVFRGQSDSDWSIESSLTRHFNQRSDHILDDEYILSVEEIFQHYERAILERFKSGAHLYLSKLPDENDDLEWLSLMQHYGVPTRLIDVTFSPHIACYFALQSAENDAAIFALEHSYFDKSYSENYNRIKDIEEGLGLLTYEPKLLNDRLLSQQGLFIVSDSIQNGIKKSIETTECLEDSLYKIIIPSHLKSGGISRLKKMNISSTSIFGGIEGFSNSLKDIVYENRKVIDRFTPNYDFDKIFN